MKKVTERYFINTLKKNIGNEYRMNLGAVDGEESVIITGTIENVYEENEAVFLKLEEQNDGARFENEKVESIEVNNFDNMFKVNNKDKSYFKIFIS